MDIVNLMNGTYSGSSPTLLDEGCLPSDLAADQRNVIRAFTLTLRPSQHSTDPRRIRQEYRNLVKNFVSNSRHGLFIETHYEFTQAMVLHFHGYTIGRKSTVGTLFSRLRRWGGYTVVKTPHDLMKWIEYCSKEDVYPPTKHSIAPPIKGTGRRGFILDDQKRKK
ncbi:MAG: hypothetical protein [Cressdnaviricota sp.]|nr:MAG: hypothetical protein [Cressdnaviricota sp.]